MTDKEPIENFIKFDLMGISDDILRGIHAYGFEMPSAIQQRAIVPLARGDDIIAQAQSGTGKTGAFVVGSLQRIDLSQAVTQVLIVSPTRELATQTHKVVSHISSFMKGIVAGLFVGGSPIMTDIKFTQKNTPHIVVATPGRIYDLVERRIVSLNRLKTIIIDEADQMLEKDFKLQIADIFEKGCVPNTTQIAIFSATMPPETEKFANSIMSSSGKEPTKILIKTQEVTLEGISQFFIDVEREDWKFSALCDIYDVITIQQTIIYRNTRESAEELQQLLRRKNFNVECIHGDMSQSDRDICMQNFREGKCRVLVATDLLARGIDVQTVSLVINYDIPVSRETYIHRIGRSGRYGRKGVAINFVTKRDVSQLNDIEKYYNTTIPEMPDLREMAAILGKL